MKALVFCYWKENRYSFNALLGAVEELILELYLHGNIFFPKNEKELFQILKEKASSYEKILIFISFFTTQLWDIKRLLTKLTSLEEREKLLLITGGPHASALPKETLNLGFDYVFVGEAEESLKAFLESYLWRDEPYPSIKGILYQKEETHFYLGKALPISLDSHHPFSLKLNKVGPIEITRGCPFLCKYCQTPRLFGTKVRHRSIEKILHYAEALLRRGIRDLRFITPNAFAYGSLDGKALNLEALQTLLQELQRLAKPYGGRIFFGSFPSEVRPEHVTEETIQLVKSFCANDNLVIGAQTGSERMLEYLMRRHTVEDVRKAVELTLKAGLKAKVDFIFGLPGETLDDLKATLSFMEELATKGAIIHAHTFMPLPQTPFMFKSAGKITSEIFQFIRKYLSQGKIFGYWERQVELARKIENEFSQLRLAKKGTKGKLLEN